MTGQKTDDRGQKKERALNVSRYVALGAVAMCVQTASAAFTFDDIDTWIGNGSNHAALVLDWNDGIEPQSLVWGYRWDGAATGEDMLRAVVEADANLYAKISAPGAFGISTFGFGYDLDSDGFGLDDATSFGVDGIAVTTSANADGAVSLDSDDHYAEGWFSSGFWTYWTSENEPFDGGAWDSALTGVSDRVLASGSWDGFSFDPVFSFTDPPSQPGATVPAPGALAPMFALLIGARRHRRRG